MELQEILLRAVSVQVRFEPRSRFADCRGQIVEELLEANALTEWTLGAEVGVSAKDRSRAFMVAQSEFRAQYEAIDNRMDTLEGIRKFVEYAIEKLAVTEASFVGVRTFWLGAVDSFDALRDWMVKELGGRVTDLVGSLGKAITDVGWTYEMHEDDPKMSLRLGPMTLEQLIGYGVFSGELRERLPPNSVFVDLDRFINARPTSSDRITEVVESSFSRNVELGERLANQLEASARGEVT